MDENTETLADRLNEEPVIFRGSTNSELGLIMTFAVIFWVPCAILLGVLFGAVVLSLGISSLAILATVWFGTSIFQSIKRGKPNNYYQHRVIIGLDRLQLRKSNLIIRGGMWDLGRTELQKNKD